MTLQRARRWRIWLLLALGAGGLQACAQNPATGGQMFSLVSAEQERSLGEQAAQEAIKAEGLFDHAGPVTTYVSQLGHRVWQNTERGHEPLQMLVLDSGTFNAWATPGYINVYRGMLPYLQSEAELAALLGHEAGHLTARHTVQGQTAATLAQLGVLAGGLILASQLEDDTVARTAIQMGSVGAALGLRAYSRQHEHEADDLAIRYLVNSGYNPQAVLGLHAAMGAYGAYQTQLEAALRPEGSRGKSLFDNWLSTHPTDAARLARAELVLQTAPQPTTLATPAGDPEGRARFNRVMNGLPYGPARLDGIARRTELAFPRQRVAWGLPQGVVCTFVGKPDMDNDKRTRPDPVWACAQPETGLQVTFFFTRSPAGTSADHALRQQFPRVAETRSFEASDGTRGVTGVLPGTLGNPDVKRVFTLPLLATERMAFAVVSYPSEAAMTQHDANLLANLPTRLRVLGESQAERLKPLQLAIRTASSGQNVANLAAAMPTGALNEVWFRALNRLTDGAPLRAGQIYRTVVDPNS